MVADELALELSRTYVTPGSRVLDPFCGSGRLLAAAPQASQRVGYDVNPLACLLTRAKLGKPDRRRVRDVIDGLDGCFKDDCEISIDRFVNGRVEWFSDTVAKSIAQILAHLNGLKLAGPELHLVAAALSATVRDVSFARNSGWKLHRLPPERRTTFDPDPVDILRRRLGYCLNHIGNTAENDGECEVRLGDVRTELRSGSGGSSGRFDIVMTSPPYGDSRTTVQYGAASGLCLSVVSQLEGLEELALKGSEIDGRCLGGRKRGAGDARSEIRLAPYWKGGDKNRQNNSVSRFVEDYREMIAAVSDSLTERGRFVLIVGCRTVGGHRFALDELSIDEANRNGLRLLERRVRKLGFKRFPQNINRFGRAADVAMKASGILQTMDEETILTFERT